MNNPTTTTNCGTVVSVRGSVVDVRPEQKAETTAEPDVEPDEDQLQGTSKN